MKIGDKIVCVDDNIKSGLLEFVGYAYPNWIKKDKIYTVREILPNDDIVPGILLEEVKNPEIYIHLLGKEQEPAFRLSRFAPINYQEKSIEEEIEAVILDPEVFDPLAF
jgi:hypothetical protein